MLNQLRFMQQTYAYLSSTHFKRIEPQNVSLYNSCSMFYNHIMRTWERETSGFSSSSPSTSIPVPWHSGQSTELIRVPVGLVSLSFPIFLHLVRFFLLDLRLALGLTEWFSILSSSQRRIQCIRHEVWNTWKAYM